VNPRNHPKAEEAEGFTPSDLESNVIRHFMLTSEISSFPGVLLVLFNHPAPHIAQYSCVNHKNNTQWDLGMMKEHRT